MNLVQFHIEEGDNLRAAIVREICHREGHNWAETTTRGDRWDRYRCIRGCGAERYGDPRGQVGAPSLRALLDELGDATVKVDRLSIIVEGK